MKTSGVSARRISLPLFLGALSLLAWSACASFPFDSLRNAQCDFWQTSDGLPHNDVISLAQTPDGYIWVGMFGASNSLVRFNGFEFASVAGLAGAAGNAPVCLAVSRNGGLWVSEASNSGSLMLWQRGKATPVDIRLPVPVHWGVPSVPLFEDRGGNLWIGGGGLVVRTPGGQVEDLSVLAKGFGEILQIAEDREGTLWFATDHGLVRHKSGTIDQPYPITNTLHSIYASKEGSLWMGTDTEPGLLRVTPSGMLIRYGEAQGLNSRGVLAICEDRESNIWLGTYSGL
jgi:ligand-binding sensor domain-containing protein